MPSSLRQVADALFTRIKAEPLEDWIKDQRDNGLSWRQIAVELSKMTDGELDLPQQTLYSWTDGYTPDEPEAAA